jgi:hypothetical protein
LSDKVGKGLKSFKIFTYFSSFKYTLKSPITTLFNYFFQLITCSWTYFLRVYRQVVGEGFIYIRGLFVIFFVDALIADDEPLWEPVE